MEDKESREVRQYDYTFTIIIPHRGIPHLLQRCVASIPERDDTQIIVVDDNSPDGDRYLELYPFLRRKNLEYYPTHEGRGAGYARNVGLDHARGKWLLFADADDFFTYCLGEMLDKYKDSEADMVFFNCSSFDCTYYTLTLWGMLWLNHMIALAKKNRKKAEYQLRYIFTSPWCRLIRHEVVRKNGIRFDEVPVVDDVTFVCHLGYYAQTVAIEPHAIYMYGIRSGSLTFSRRSVERSLTRMDVSARYERFLREHGVKVTSWRLGHYAELVSIILHREWPLWHQCIALLRQYGFTRSEIVRGIISSSVGRVIRRLKIFWRYVLLGFSRK